MTRAADAPLIVLATDSAVPSGVGEHMLTLARAIEGTYRVALAFPAEGEGAAFLTRADRSGIAARPVGDEAAFPQWLRDAGAAVLHVHAGIGWEGHRLGHAGRIAGVPVVRTEHLPYLLTDDAQKAEHRCGVAMADRLVFVSEAAAGTYREAGFSDARFATVQNGIDRPLPTKSRDSVRQSLGIGAGDMMAITVARFTAQKNHDLLIAAARLVAPASPRIRFVCVGDGPDRDAMQERVAEAGLDRAVTFLGERGDVPDLLAAADLFVSPSRFEGLPLAVLEAMALGLAIVATRIGGTCEALGAGYPWLVDPDDADGLAAAIAAALAQDGTRHDLGRRNRQRFEDRFSADRMGREMAAIYGSLICERACPA